MPRFSPICFTLCLTALVLSACSSAPQVQSAKIDQSGALKVHPALLGQPVPPELQEKDAPSRVARVEAGENSPPPNATAAATVADNVASPRTQREVYFDYKEAVIKREFVALLESHGRFLAAHPKAKVRIEGHADERGPDGVNQRLGALRAEAVRQVLIGQGAAPRQIRTISFGKSRPKVPGQDEASWAENRRAEVVYDREQ